MQASEDFDIIVAEPSECNITSHELGFEDFLAADPEVPGSISGVASFLGSSGSGTGFTQPL
jgi:hypothetical protein